MKIFALTTILFAPTRRIGEFRCSHTFTFPGVLRLLGKEKHGKVASCSEKMLAHISTHEHGFCHFWNLARLPKMSERIRCVFFPGGVSKRSTAGILSRWHCYCSTRECYFWIFLKLFVLFLLESIHAVGILPEKQGELLLEVSSKNKLIFHCISAVVA